MGILIFEGESKNPTIIMEAIAPAHFSIQNIEILVHPRGFSYRCERNGKVVMGSLFDSIPDKIALGQIYQEKGLALETEGLVACPIKDTHRYSYCLATRQN